MVVKKITIAITALFIIINILLICFKTSNEVIINPENLKADPSSYIPPIVEKININNNQIQSLQAENVLIKACKDNFCIKLKGDVAFEKPKNFRLRLYSIFGIELDVGSNNEEFWYWSKRDKEKGLHYSNYENIGNTRLKISFNPLSIMKSLGLNEVKISSLMDFKENDNYYIINEIKRDESSLQKVINTTVLDKNIDRIVGYYVKDLIGNLIASSEIEYKNNMPNIVKLTSNQENSSLIIYLTNCKINNSIEKSFWEMPNFNPKINIGTN